MGGFLALLKMALMLADDIVLVFKKTSSVLVDDLAVGAAKSSEFGRDREGMMIFKIGKGAILNKIILLPLILALDYYLPTLIVMALLLGGAFLSFEATEKIVHALLNKHELEEDSADSDEKKVKNAVTVDFILSIEIIIIAMATVTATDFQTKAIVVSMVAFSAVFAVYGLIWLLVKMDDFGFWLKEQSEHPYLHAIANVLINSLPYLIQILAVVGTVAMLVVGGGIYIHNIELFHQLNEFIVNYLTYDLLSETIVGFIVGFLTIIILKLGKAILK